LDSVISTFGAGSSSRKREGIVVDHEPRIRRLVAK
jgi:hypothetical protein